MISNQICFSVALMQKSTTLNISGFNEEHGPALDYYFWYKFLETNEVYKCRDNLIIYRIFDNDSLNIKTNIAMWENNIKFR